MTDDRDGDTQKDAPTTSCRSRFENMERSDLLADARKTMAEIAGRRERTHFTGCRRDHAECMIAALVDEVERLHEAIRRLAEQDATLSVQGGSVTVTLDATLTALEREAVGWAFSLAAAFPEFENTATCAATLRGLLERLK